LSTPSFLITLPPEIYDPGTLSLLNGLNFYLSLYEQDPEWVAFIQQELNNNTPPEDIPGRLRLFLQEERISSRRLDLIRDFEALYERNGALPKVEPYILEEALRSYLDHIRGVDNLSILQAAFQDMRDNGGGSTFFHRVVEYNREFLDAQSAASPFPFCNVYWNRPTFILSGFFLVRSGDSDWVESVSWLSGEKVGGIGSSLLVMFLAWIE